MRWFRNILWKPHTSTLEIGPELNDFFSRSVETYNQYLHDLESTWKISRYRWRYDQKQRKLFFHHGKDKLPPFEAKAQILGSYYKTTHLWEWAWNTPNILKKVSKDSRKVKKFGRKHKLAPLVLGSLLLSGKEEYATYFAAMAVDICSAKGIYRGESSEQAVYFLLHDLKQTTVIPKNISEGL